MNTETPTPLPASGLGDEVLGKFLEEEQRKADASLAAAGETAGETNYHLVTFQLAGETYGVDIASVQEIIRATDITPVPGAPAHVRGVLNLRGKIIPVVDLRTRFGLPDGEQSDDRRIVVTEIGAKRIGVLVDAVSQVLKVAAGVVEDLPEEASSIDHQFILGVGKLESTLIVILDVRRAFVSVN